MCEAISRARVLVTARTRIRPATEKPGVLVLAAQPLAISLCLGVGSDGSRRGRGLPGDSAQRTATTSPARRFARPLKIERDALATSPVSRRLGVCTNSFNASVAGSLGAG